MWDTIFVRNLSAKHGCWLALRWVKKSILSTNHIKAGKFKALAIASRQRVSALPDVPTLHEAGFVGAESGSWVGMLAPAG